MDAEGEEELQERPCWRQNSYCQFILSARKIGHPSTSARRGPGEQDIVAAADVTRTRGEASSFNTRLSDAI